MRADESRVAENAAFLGLEGVLFGFQLSCKLEQLGDVHVMDFWMDTRTLYGQRGKSQTNLEVMANYFFRRCALADTHHESDVQETYLLARLCPLVRGTAGQAVFADARLSRLAATRRSDSAELEQLLCSLQRMPRRKEREMTMTQFHHQTAEMAAMPRWTPDQIASYKGLCDELFCEARQVLVDRGPIAVDILFRRWRNMKKRIGRRSRPTTELKRKRTALDVLSYEARTAVHRCYSCVWNDLIPHLLSQFKLHPHTVRYLYLKHLERVSSSRILDTSFHLFHGHIFGLHPAFGMLMKTPTGRMLVGNVVKADTADETTTSFQQLLAAVYTSFCFYLGKREDGRRTKRAIDAGEGGIGEVENAFLKRRSARRRTRRRRDG